MYWSSTINMGSSGVCARVCRGAVGHLARNVSGDTMHSFTISKGKTYRATGIECLQLDVVTLYQ
jgi:hypothetical protein